jgi:hypothetical protein
MSNNPYRTMCADMLEAFDGLPCETNYRGQSRPIVCIDEEPFDRARALLAQPEPEELTEQELWQIWDDIDSTIPDILRAAIAADRARYGRPTSQPLPFGYIDPEHKGEDLVLLETFYRACNAEGGTADEIHLRGIRAVLATHSTPQPPADGELTVNLRMDLSSECLKRLCDGLAAAVKPNGGYRALTTDDDISGEFIGEQQVGVEWWLPEHGCDSLENTLDSIKGRLFAAVRDWLPTAVIST